MMEPASRVTSPKGIVADETATEHRAALNAISGNVKVVLFDFDGTLTKTPGMHARRQQKVEELRERCWLLKPRLGALRDAGFKLGVLSKSTRETLENALEATGLRPFFEGPVVGKAVGFEGKAGFIRDFCAHGEALAELVEFEEGWHRVLLVDDDTSELERCVDESIQTYAAPATGGLQASDFDEIFRCLGLPWTSAQCLTGPDSATSCDHLRGAGDEAEDGMCATSPALQSGRPVVLSDEQLFGDVLQPTLLQSAAIPSACHPQFMKRNEGSCLDLEPVKLRKADTSSAMSPSRLRAWRRRSLTRRRCKNASLSCRLSTKATLDKVMAQTVSARL